MRTSRPFSTISYNTDDFLRLKLDDLVQKGHISFYSFVNHYAEEDEKKEHKHLLIMPDGQIDTKTVTNLLQELDLKNPHLPPLGVMPWRSSKFDDWFLYVSHDVAYLASKGQTRKYHYQPSDFISSNDDFFNELIHTIDRSKYQKSKDFYDAAMNGVSFEKLLATGQIPVPQFNQFLQMYNYITGGQAYRNGRETHTPKFDDETGELL